MTSRRQRFIEHWLDSYEEVADSLSNWEQPFMMAAKEEGWSQEASEMLQEMKDLGAIPTYELRARENAEWKLQYSTIWADNYSICKDKEVGDKLTAKPLKHYRWALMDVFGKVLDTQEVEMDDDNKLKPRKVK